MKDVDVASFTKFKKVFTKPPILKLLNKLINKQVRKGAEPTAPAEEIDRQQDGISRQQGRVACGFK